METSQQTIIERTADLELTVKRTVQAPAHIVFKAWTDADIFRQWWVPKSFGLTLHSCDLDVRVGGQYRLAFVVGDSTMEFFGTYTEVTPPSRLVWTNEEDPAGTTITTVTFEEVDGKTLVTVHDKYPSKGAMDSGATGAMPEVLNQLDELLAGLQSS